MRPLRKRRRALLLWLVFTAFICTAASPAKSGPAAGQGNTAAAAGKKAPKKAPASPKKKTAAAKPKQKRTEKNPHEPRTRFWDFQSPTLKKVPAEWEALAGTWQLAAEPEHPGNRVIRQSAVKRNFQYLLSRGAYANFEFSARLRADSFEHKTRNWQMGLIFRRQDAKNYYKFRITAANIALLRCSSESLAVLPGSQGSTQAASATGRTGKEDEHMVLILPLSGKPDQWYTLSVACYGERIILKLDGREIRMVFDQGGGSGRLGVFSYKTQALFDDFRLFALPVPEWGQEGLALSRKQFKPGQDQDVLIYYRHPRPGPVEVRVLGPDKKLFHLVAKGWHGPGVNSVAWDGKGMLGDPARPGQYILEVEAEGAKRRVPLQVR